jgi:hypothetical protein
LQLRLQKLTLERMVELGAIGLGLVIGWLLPTVRVSGDRATAASAGIVALVTGAVALDRNTMVGATALTAALASAYVHRAWLEELRRRYRPGRQA